MKFEPTPFNMASLHLRSVFSQNSQYKARSLAIARVERLLFYKHQAVVYNKRANKLLSYPINIIDNKIKEVAKELRLDFSLYLVTCEGCNKYFILDYDPKAPFVCSERCGKEFQEKYP